MSRFLFCTWEGGGHVQPMLLAAKGLAKLGHQTLIVSDACNAPEAAAHGIPFQPWRNAPSRLDRDPQTDPIKDWLARTPIETIEALCDGIMSGPAGRYGADAAEAIDAFRPDVVVTHELLFGVMAAAEARRVPLAVFAANVWSLPTLPRAAPFGGGLRAPVSDFDFDFYAGVTRITRAAYQHGLPALNAARATLGLPPLAEFFEQLDAAGRVLLATSEAFDFATETPPSFRYVGPYLEDPTWAEPLATRPAADRPLVLVSFSTMYQGQEAVLRRSIEALGMLPVRAIVTLGPNLAPADFPAPANVSVIASIRHSELYPQTAVMITHAGHASALRPLIAGVPLVCIPLGRDQPDNAVRVTERGAGIRLLPDAGVEEIRAAVGRMLDDPSYAAAARALGARIAADAANRSAERELIEFASSGASHDQADLLPGAAAPPHP
jgi:MGT family glycosyltransferase